MLTKADQMLCTISRRREKVSMMMIMASIKMTSITMMDDNDICRWRPYWRDLLASPTGRRSAGDHHDDTGDLDVKMMTMLMAWMLLMLLMLLMTNAASKSDWAAIRR